MPTRFATAVRSAIADVVTAKIDAGAAAGTLKVYTGIQPATPGDAATGTLLATFTLTDPAAAAAAAGVADFDFDPDLSATVAATGTAGWARFADSDGAGVVDGEVGTSGKMVNFDSVTWTVDGTVNLTTGTVTAPLS